MDQEKLTELIVDEILKKLAVTPCVLTNNNQTQTAIVLWSTNLDKYSILKNQYNINQYEDNIREYDVLIIERLCLRGLSNLALGTSASTEERFILKALLQGKRVYILEDGIEHHKYKITAPKTLYNQYMRYEDTLKHYGVEIIQSIDYILYQNNKTTATGDTKVLTTIQDNFSKAKQQVLMHKKVLTEVDIRRAIEKGPKTIEISKNTIITPLAEDFIRAHHLEVNKI